MQASASKSRLSRDEQAALSRQAILDAALLLFAENGFSATSTRRIAKDAGVSEGLIFHHFPTKQDLLLAIVETGRTLPHAVAKLLENAEAMPVEAFAHTVASSFATLMRPGRPEARLFRVVLGEAQRNAELHSVIGGVQQGVLGMVGSYLSSRIEAGELRRDLVPSVAARCLLGSLIVFFVMNHGLDAETWDAEAGPYARAAVEFWLVGACAGATEGS